ncbi:hypothetical protein [Thiolinea disciformis]|uniref:hypothetical protein n=1 Tax=Thiolinea disciformis TaxID=125614 RepID=UPI0003654A91|nr:hypothetical protein [Thiolinea disciformis]
MAIRRIKANKARVEAGFVIIESDSLKETGSVLVFISTFITVLILYLSDEDQSLNQNFLLVNFAISAVIALFSFILFPGRIIRKAPEADLVEIKEYKEENRVTVVLDDARVKKGGPSDKYKEDLGKQ